MDRSALGVPVVLLALGLGSMGVGGLQLSAAKDVVSTDVSDAAPPADIPTLALEAGGETDASLETSPAPTSSDDSVITCSNAVMGFRISYPSDWYTLSFRPKQDCRFFSSSPLDFTADTRYPTSEIAIYQLRVDYEDWVGSFNDPSISISSSEEITIADRRATRIDFAFSEGSGGGLVYLVEDPAGVLVLQAEDQNSADPAVTALILDQMASTFLPL